MTEATSSTRTRLRVLALPLALDESSDVLRERAAGRLGIDADAIVGLELARRALDARRRGGERRLVYRVHVDCEIDLARAGRRAQGALERAQRKGHAQPIEPGWPLLPERVAAGIPGARIAVVGAGPAGLFAALPLAAAGARVDLFDRGPALRDRGRAVARFLRTRELDPERNLLFGEGGAGTYSDGKLYTRSSHPLEGSILEELVACGADPRIAWDARAHIGTDRLHRILPRLRARLESAGVRFHFESRVDGLFVDREEGRVRALELASGERFECDAVVLAPGHSARDTLRRLATQGVIVEAKPFQLGVRVEHPQSLIDAARHGSGPEARALGAADYGLVCKAAGGLPAVHSFCMCPGGQIVASVSEPGLLCTNGMSNSRHSSPFANAGIVVTLGPKEFGAGAFAGVDYQAALERRFFEAGGGDYTAPAQRVPDFLEGRESSSLGRTSYKPGVVPGRIDALLPGAVRDGLRRALVDFDRKLAGFASAEGVLVGIESRSSGPLRLPRDPEARHALGLANLFPVGEGAGYAGGIMSAAIDGARSARALLERGLAASP